MNKYKRKKEPTANWLFPAVFVGGVLVWFVDQIAGVSAEELVTAGGGFIYAALTVWGEAFGLPPALVGAIITAGIALILLLIGGDK